MRHQTQEFLVKFLESHKGLQNALEVGSWDVNGNINNIIAEHGIPLLRTDMRGGDNVTLIINGHDLFKHFGKSTFDLVMCFDTFEHDDKFWLTLKNMKQILIPGGWLLLGFPGRNCPLHDHPEDYYRFMPSVMNLFLKEYEDIFIESEGDDETYGWGRKPL